MSSNLKKLIKHIIRYNILDYGIPRLRKLYKKLGILDFMDTRFYWIAWKIVHWALRDKIWTGKTTGIANIPPTRAAIFVPNHSNALDPFFSGVCASQNSLGFEDRKLFSSLFPPYSSVHKFNPLETRQK